MPLLRPPAVPESGLDFDSVRAGLGVPASFTPEVEAEAERVAAAPPGLADGRPDRTDLALVTIDPVGSMDLDQAMFLERTGDGFRVYYAIADVASFVVPGGAVDTEARRRGQTLYSPDLATPLHPTRLSQDAASLLPGRRRPAVLWRIDLDEQGAPGAVEVSRAVVESVARLDYLGVRADADAGRLHPSITALPDIGRLRKAAARARHAITLNLPDAQVQRAADGHWTLALRAINPVEDFNAEISLLTGMCAATIMLRGGIGILRTLPDPDADQIAALRRSAAALGVGWPQGAAPSDVVAGIDPGTPIGAAFLEDAVRLLRGAGYTPFDQAPPALTDHAGVGAPYAHVTAPLRRLVDRFGTEICLALHAGRPVPDWVRAGLPDLPVIMASSDHRAADLERACTWAVTEFLLSGREGDEFDGQVVQLEPHASRATVLLLDPPVRAHAPAAGLTEGSSIRVRLTALDPQNRSVSVVPVQ